MTNQYPTSRTRGYTILELLVAVAITLILMMIVNQLFFDTTRAVGHGAALSDILASGREAGRQIQEDAAAMLSADDPGRSGRDPDRGGVLVIINRVIGDWNGDGSLGGDSDGDGIVDPGEIEATLESDLEGVPFTGPNGREFRRLVRSDQLMFIRSTEYTDTRSTRKRAVMPLCPSDEFTFTTPEIDPSKAPIHPCLVRARPQDQPRRDRPRDGPGYRR